MLDYPEPYNGENDYKKRQEAYQKRIATLESKAPSNKVIKNMQKETKEEKNQMNDAKSSSWRMVCDAERAAKELYMEEDLTFEAAIDEMVTALQTIKAMGQAKPGSKTNKQLAAEVGY